MEALELFAKVLLALAVVGFVGYPLLRQDWEEEEVELPEELQDLYRRKESTYSALKELEFDFRTGKLSQTDFNELDAKYRSEAIELLEALELAEKGEAPKPRKEPKLRAERPAGAAGEGGAARRGESPRQSRRPAGTATATAPRVGQGLLCLACDAENPANARFCAACGAELEQEPPRRRARKVVGAPELVCDDCGQPVGPEHSFCAGCGAEVHA
jgi:hypothetical protein